MSYLRNYAQQIGLKINQKKTELIILNITNPSPIRVNGEDLPPNEEFTYLGGIVRHDGGVGNGNKTSIKQSPSMKQPPSIKRSIFKFTKFVSHIVYSTSIKWLSLLSGQGLCFDFPIG